VGSFCIRPVYMGCAPCAFIYIDFLPIKKKKYICCFHVLMSHKFVLLQYYQALFRDGECFLHVVSLLNGNLDEANAEDLVLNVLQTLTCLLANNDASKVILHFSLPVLSFLSVFVIWAGCFIFISIFVQITY
jgi:hypothetical protein